jgi:hypothetical protein
MIWFGLLVMTVGLAAAFVGYTDPDAESGFKAFVIGLAMVLIGICMMLGSAAMTKVAG